MMNLKEFTQPGQLVRNSFLWSEVRLIVAAVALFIGGVPPILAFNPIAGLNGVLILLLRLAWLVSGAASVYLAYQWNARHQVLFGRKDSKDRAAFLVSVVSGINLGLVGLLGTNIGMSISSDRTVFAVVGLAYLWAANHLYSRFKAAGQKLF